LRPKAAQQHQAFFVDILAKLAHKSGERKNMSALNWKLKRRIKISKQRQINIPKDF